MQHGDGGNGVEAAAVGASGAVVGMQRHGRPAAVQWWWEQHDSVYLMLFLVIIFTRLKTVFNKCRDMFFHTPDFFTL